MSNDEVALKIMEIMGRDYIIQACRNSGLSITEIYKHTVWELDHLDYDPQKVINKSMVL